ncbi:helix-turn-helix transcriptional regulator [uncultured Rhodoblastus sp.]|uniref:helix-turn-helix domain-containing protein n=1 Tax=uncultured Rhodoblastus sp. TaxID=543037 RepID=UPI0025CBE30C|nr:helix-turn-helix transcriptional regulator [uncultured Rhodoblastus sp.]
MAQCRAARALLDWSREQLAEASKVGLRTIVDFERGAREPRELTKDALCRALQAAGVEFIPENGGGAGVRLRNKRMSNEPIYVDASRSAVLNHGVTSINCLTLQEAKIAFDNLPKDRQEIASITSVGRTYSPSEIQRLHYGPKPEA